MANKNISHLAEYINYTSESITPEVGMEMDKLGLDERYNRALKARQDVTSLLSHSLQDLAAIANVPSENEKPKSEIQSRRFHEEKLTQEIKTLRGAEAFEEKAYLLKTLKIFRLNMRT